MINKIELARFLRKVADKLDGQDSEAAFTIARFHGLTIQAMNDYIERTERKLRKAGLSTSDHWTN